MSKFTLWFGRASSLAVVTGMAYMFATYEPPTNLIEENASVEPALEPAAAAPEHLLKHKIPPLTFSSDIPRLDYPTDGENLHFSHIFSHAVMGLPPLPESSVLASYAFHDDSIPINPYLVKALEENADARAYVRILKEACDAHNLDWRMCANQIFRESRHFDPAIVQGLEPSNRGAYGIAQFMPETAAEYDHSINDLSDPKTSIDLYARHMEALKNKYDGDIVLALIAYNAGNSTVAWIREELRNSNATGAQAIEFLEARNDTLGNKNPHAYHVETLNYVKETLGLSAHEWEHPEWVEAQNQRFNQPYFVGGLVDENKVISNLFPIFELYAHSSIERSLAVTQSPRPQPRPESIAEEEFASSLRPLPRPPTLNKS